MGLMSIMHWIIVALILIVSVTINFIPTIVAFARQHHRRIWIFVLNLFLGWTGIGWVIALIWALTAPQPAAAPPSPPEPA